MSAVDLELPELPENQRWFVREDCIDLQEYIPQGEWRFLRWQDTGRPIHISNNMETRKRLVTVGTNLLGGPKFSEIVETRTKARWLTTYRERLVPPLNAVKILAAANFIHEKASGNRFLGAYPPKKLSKAAE